MNYVILNGKDSRDIRGLIIQSLPSIVKPNIRTTIEEIDGRDGDIVTKLGYSAYDKEMTIGLYGKYDLDAIMTFFDSEGQVTFSNEPYMYYKYMILDEIEFERLIRFKQAKVTLHVQPFKYSTLEGVKAVNNPSSKEITVLNQGNFTSKPKIGIIGTGTINLSLNGTNILIISLGDTGSSIIIDADGMEAYNSDGLMNRAVTGSYDNLKLKTGINTFTWDGNITRFTIENYSRWL